MRILSLTVVFLIFYGATAHAQKTTIKLKEGTASRLIGDMKDGQRITRFIKSELQLAFIQNTTTIYCDSAWLFRDKNAIEAFGNVKIVEGDSITITSRHLEYDGNTKKAKLRNNVVFTKLATAKLYTDFLDYDRMINEARYFNGGRLVDSINTLVSRKGYYDATSNLASFKRNVKVTNPDYTMDSDSLQYNSRTKIIYFVTETKVINKDSSTFIYKSGQYNTITRTSDLREGVGQSLNYDIIGITYDIDDVRKVYKVRGDVSMTSKEENLTIYGQKVDLYRLKNIAKVYDRAYVAKVTEEGDTLFMTADTLVSIDDVDPKKKRILAYHNVKIFKPDLQGVADSLEYRSADSTLYFYKNPVLWTDGNQMTADSISMLIENNTISKIFLDINSFVISQDTSKNFNQIKGRKMVADFRSGKLNKVFVNGNGESIYFALDEKTGILTGMNNVLCSNIIIRFKEGKVSNISFIKQPDGNFIPPHELEEENTRLTDFKWRIDERPEKKDVVKELPELQETISVEKKDTEPTKKKQPEKRPKS
jgi:lipopolysaccharide export system protein LptA